MAIATVAAVIAATVPTAHRIVWPDGAQRGSLPAATKLTPAGSWKPTSTPVASMGPLFPYAAWNRGVWVTRAVSFGPPTATVRSAWVAGTTARVAVTASSRGVGSAWSDLTVNGMVYVPSAKAVTTIGTEPEDPDATVPTSQLTSWPPTATVQKPDERIRFTFSPAGNTTSTVRLVAVSGPAL